MAARTPSPDHPAPGRHQVRPWLTAIALAAPPAAWIAQMTAGEMLSTGACRPLQAGHVGAMPLALLAVSLVCLAVVLAGGWAGWRAWRRVHREKPDKAIDTGEGRTRFLALIGIMESALFAVAVIITGMAMSGVPPCPIAALPPSVPPPGMCQGEYVARLGDCVSCHSAPGQHDFAGGFPLHAPIGTIYGSNITPDPVYGIGAYSREDFRRAVRQGVARDGRHLYPAMPYTSFAAMSDSDVDALYRYMITEVRPVHAPAPQTRLWFPFNQRWAIRFWNLLFLHDHRFVPDPAADPEWNRGAYLVESVAHCGACHTPRGLAYEERATDRSSRLFLSGSNVDKWYAANLTADNASGLGRWSRADIAQFLATGEASGGAAFGSMRQMVENSGQYMTPSDRQAIARYIKSVPARGERSSYLPANGPAATPFEQPGAGIYAQDCSGCHKAEGQGIVGTYPKLAGNPIVMSADATSQIRLVLEGGTTARTPGGPAQRKMPAFANLSDRQIADVVSYVRQNWGNRAAPVSERKVAKLRNALRKWKN